VGLKQTINRQCP